MHVSRAQLPHAVAVAAVAACLLVGCESGDGSTLDERGRAIEHPYAPGIGSKIGAMTFSPVWLDVSWVFLDQLCTGCHSGASAPRGLDLRPEFAFDKMVGQPSAERPSMALVAPGQPDLSYLIVKLEGGAGMKGRRMPRGRPARPQAEIDILRDWITSLAEPVQ